MSETVGLLPVDLGLESLELHDIDSSNPATERDLISPLKDTHPTIVGVAVKRNLKITDTESFDMLDSWQKTVMRCAPIASFDETMSECVERDNNNVTATSGGKKCVRFDLRSDTECHEEEEEAILVEIDQNTFTASCDSDDNDTIDDDVVDTLVDDLVHDGNRILLHETQSTGKCFTCDLECNCRSVASATSVTDDDDDDDGNDDDIQINKTTAQCASHTAHNDDDGGDFVDFSRRTSITVPTTTSPIKVSLSSSLKSKSTARREEEKKSLLVEIESACAQQKLTHSLWNSERFRNCENLPSIENEKTDAHVQDNKTDKTITRIQPTDKDSSERDNDYCTSGCSSSSTIESFNHVLNKRNHPPKNQLIRSEENCEKIIVPSLLDTRKKTNQVKKDECNGNSSKDTKLVDTSEFSARSESVLSSVQKRKEEFVDVVRNKEEDVDDDDNIESYIKFPPSIYQENVIVLLENLSLSRQSENFLLQNNLCVETTKKTDKCSAPIVCENFSERSLSCGSSTRPQHPSSLSNALVAFEELQPQLENNSTEQPDGNNCDIFAASNRLKRLEERIKGFYYTKKLLTSTPNSTDDDECVESSDISHPLISFSSTESIAAVCKNFVDLSPLNKAPLPSSTSVDSPPPPPLPTTTPPCLQHNQNNIHDEDNTIDNVDTSNADHITLEQDNTKRTHELTQGNFRENPYIDRREKVKNNFHLLDNNNSTSFPPPPPPALPFPQHTENNCEKTNLWTEKWQTLKLLEDNLVGKKEIEVDLPTPEPSTDSEEVSKLFSDHNDDEEEHDQSSAPINYGTLLHGDLYTNCEFDVRHLQNYNSDYGQIYECYDELEQDENDDNVDEEDVDDDDDDNESCDCSLEAVPIYKPQPVIMRETAGQLRGLLKKPNRPPPVRKNRVVFDETRNEFFEADYIILIREDCPYDEEDEEPCTCGEHELVRLCCEEGCQCPGYTTAEDGRTPQSPKFAPPIEFVDQATLSPPEGYKDGGALTNALGGALGGHVFGAQHIQQLQVIQRLQQQRAAMLAARQSTTTVTVPVGQAPAAAVAGQQVAVQNSVQPVCTECAECAECAAKQMQDEEIESPCSEDVSPLDVPHVALVPIQTTSPERRITQKEIIAGEERPKYLSAKHQEPPIQQQQPTQPGNSVAGTTTTTPTGAAIIAASLPGAQQVLPPSAVPLLAVVQQQQQSGLIANATIGYSQQQQQHPQLQQHPQYDIGLNIECDDIQNSNHHSNVTATIAGILKGGKLWKNETTQCDEITNVTSDEEGGSKRSVRFNESIKDKLDEPTEREGCDGEAQPHIVGEVEQEQERPPIPAKKHTSLFHNALRPNSAVRQLFPAVQTTPAAPLTHEALRAFEDSKRSSLTKVVHSDSETDTIKRTIERNALRRSLIKYEPKKKPQKVDTSLEERIRRLTCDIDESGNDTDLDNNVERDDHHESNEINEMERRDSPAGEENPQQSKYIPDKSFSPSSSASSSSSGSTSAYKKITEIFNRDRRQERIPEADENPIVIIPQQDCRCPAAPDLGMGIQMPAVHTQIHQTPPRQNESRRQFLSTLVPLTACVAGQRDDFSYYTLAPGERGSTASSQYSEYSLGDIEAALRDDIEVRKVAPDVIAGTPGQESDELAVFAQQQEPRTERLKKRYSAESSTSAPNSGAASDDDDDEQNDYGFNKRPSVRGIKPRFGSTNEIIQQMQAQLTQSGPVSAQNSNPNSNHTHTLPKSQPQNQIASQQKHQIAAAHHQHTAAWTYYPELPPRAPVDHANANYYTQIAPGHARHSYHGHEEATIYQNCHTVSMEQHHYGHFARSPTRRPESPPPLRNYHQTMVLIPYNTEPYAHYSSNEQVPQVAQHFQRHNVLEYQQVTQQTIRVPMGYPLPGMQLHVVAGRSANAGAHPQYAQTYSRVAGRNFQQYPQEGVKFSERGAPEGAASVHPPDCNALLSPTSGQPAISPQIQQHQHQQQQQTNGSNQNGQSQQQQQQPGVFYAMNV